MSKQHIPAVPGLYIVRLSCDGIGQSNLLAQYPIPAGAVTYGRADNLRVRAGKYRNDKGLKGGARFYPIAHIEPPARNTVEKAIGARLRHCRISSPGRTEGYQSNPRVTEWCRATIEDVYRVMLEELARYPHTILGGID